MIELRITEDMPIVGLKLKDLPNKNIHSILIGAVMRVERL